MASSHQNNEPPNFRLDGKIAIVTGGGRGLGLAIAHGLAGYGAQVVITGRTEQTLSGAAASFPAGSRVAWHVCDVARESAVVDLQQWVAGKIGDPDILVNNAGINPYYKSGDQTTLSEWQELIDVNLTGVFLCCRIFAGPMLTRGSGSIVNITSVAGHVGLAKSAAYCAAKGGVEMLTRSLALDWAKKGVRVNAVAPAYFETDLTEGMRNHAQHAERVQRATPLGRFGHANEIAGAVIFLASDAASYVTGQTILVDGGWTAA